MANGLLAGIGAGLTSGVQSFQDARKLRMAQEQALREEESKKRALAIDAAKSGLRFDDQGNVQRDESLIIEDPLKKEKDQLEVEKLRKEVSGTGLISPKDQLDLQLAQTKLALAKQELETKKNAPPKATVAEQSIDRAFAKTYDEMVTGGGDERVQANIDKLRQQAERLKTVKANAIQKNLAGTPLLGPLFASELEDIKNNIDSVTIEDLKKVLGGQVTEGDRIEFTKLGFNTRLPLEEQARRVEKRAEIIERALNRTREAIDYYQNEGKGSLAGFRPGLLNAVRDPKLENLNPSGLIQNTTRPNETQPLQAQQKNDGLKKSGLDPDAVKYSAMYELPYDKALQIIESRRRGQAR